MKNSLKLFVKAVDSDLVKTISRICSIETTDSETKYMRDWLGRTSNSSLVAKPSSTLELSNLLRFCHNEKQPVTVVGGNTGLSGGTLGGSNELIVSMDKMQSILNIDRQSGTVLVEGGVVLENLQTKLHDIGLTTPYDLGARGSCTVDGNVATHAGGTNFVRYGPLRGYVMGLEVVLADGTILDLLSDCWKDNTGIDLKQLFIGSEGALGVISKVRLKCPVLPAHRTMAVLALPDSSFEDSVLSTLSVARTVIGENLYAFEFVDSAGIELLPQVPFDIGRDSLCFLVLVEARGSTDQQETINSFVEQLVKEQRKRNIQSGSQSGSLNGTVESRLEQMKKLWELRESVPVRMASLGPNLKFDVSLPLPQYYALVEAVRRGFGSHPCVKTIVGYGHVGDGNLHLNIALSQNITGNVKTEISDFVYSFVENSKGSISAEHGIGRDKLLRLKGAKPREVLTQIWKIKKLFDPNNILNPGRTVVAETDDSILNPNRTVVTETGDSTTHTVRSTRDNKSTNDNIA